MINLHPSLSALPLGVFFVWTVFELSQLRKKVNLKIGSISVSEYISILSLIAVTAAFLSGYQANWQLSDKKLLEHGEAIGFHHLFGRLLLFLTIATVILCWVSERATHARGIFKIIFILLLLLNCLLLGFTGHFGGMLVFERGVGVLSS